MGRRGRRGRGGVDGGSSPSVWIMSWRWKGEGRRREEKREEGENWGGVRKRNSPLLFFLFPVSRVGLGGRWWLCPHYHSIAATGRRERRKKKSSEEEEKTGKGSKNNFRTVAWSVAAAPLWFGKKWESDLYVSFISVSVFFSRCFCCCVQGWETRPLLYISSSVGWRSVSNSISAGASKSQRHAPCCQGDFLNRTTLRYSNTHCIQITSRKGEWSAYVKRCSWSSFEKNYVSQKSIIFMSNGSR